MKSGAPFYPSFLYKPEKFFYNGFVGLRKH